MALFQQRKLESETGVLLRWMDARFKKKKTVTLFITGNLGTGKSYVSIDIGVLWYKYHFKKDFPVNHICFDMERAMDLLTSGELKPGELIILEEVGVNLNSKLFWSKTNQFFNYYMQTYRAKQIFIVFNCPVFSMLDKSTRILVNANFITQKIDYNEKVCIVKPLFLQLNQQSGKIYNRYLRITTKNPYGYRIRKPIKRMGFHLPPKELLEEYERNKNMFLDVLGKKVLENIKVGDKKPLTEFQSDIFYYVKDNPGLLQKEYAEHFGKKPERISENISYIIKKGYNIQKYLRKSPFPE